MKKETFEDLWCRVVAKVRFQFPWANLSRQEQTESNLIQIYCNGHPMTAKWTKEVEDDFVKFDLNFEDEMFNVISNSIIEELKAMNEK